VLRGGFVPELREESSSVPTILSTIRQDQASTTPYKLSRDRLSNSPFRLLIWKLPDRMDRKIVMIASGQLLNDKREAISQNVSG